MFIGVDANGEGLLETAKRAARKPAKGGVDNLVLVQAHAEEPPEELVGCASRVTVYFPWASLLFAIVGTNERGLAGLASLLREGGVIDSVFSHDPARDGAVAGMPELTASFFAGDLAARYAAVGLELSAATTLSRDDVRELPTSWAKRLGYGVERTVWRLAARRSSPHAAIEAL